MLEDKIYSFKGRQAKVLGHQHTFKSAVLLPLVREGSEYLVVFEKRAQNLNRQPGEICFPGGEIEPFDKGAKNSAIRETCEELGLEPPAIEVVAPLDVMVSPFNTIIIPYLAFIRSPQQIKMNTAEVEKLLYVPLQFFMEQEPRQYHIRLEPVMENDFPFDLIPYGKNYPFREGTYPQVFYQWEGEVIWGLTARIMHHFVELLIDNQPE